MHEDTWMMLRKFTLALFLAGLPISALAECPSLNEADAMIVLANLCKTKTTVSRAFLEQAKNDLVAFGKQLKDVVNAEDFKSLREVGSHLPVVSKRIEELWLLKSRTKEQRLELTTLLNEAARIKNARNTLVQSWVRRIVNPERDIYLSPSSDTDYTSWDVKQDMYGKVSVPFGMYDKVEVFAALNENNEGRLVLSLNVTQEPFTDLLELFDGFYLSYASRPSTDEITLSVNRDSNPGGLSYNSYHGVRYGSDFNKFQEDEYELCIKRSHVQLDRTRKLVPKAFSSEKSVSK